MNEDKMITSLLDVAMNSAQEILVASMRNKAEARVYADQVVELSNMVQALNQRIQEMSQHNIGLENKVGHLDNALEQLSRAQNDLRLMEERYTSEKQRGDELALVYEEVLKKLIEIEGDGQKPEPKSSVKKFK
jgi:flagellar biosynthesis chaperone FliJ